MENNNLSQLEEKLFSPHEDERIEAAQALAAQKDPRALPSLCRALKDASFGPFLVALVSALGNLKDPRAIPALAETYQRARSDLYRLPILRALGEIGTPEATPTLLDALSAKDGSPARTLAARLLAESGAIAALPHLLEAFSSSLDPSPFAEALITLGQKFPEHGIGDQIAGKLLFGDLSSEGRLAAVQILAALDAHGKEAILKTLAKSEDAAIRRAAKRALKS